MLDAKKLQSELVKTREFLQKELGAIKTGRAHPALVEDITAEAYGAKMRIKEMATITAPEARTIKIEPWDKTQINAIQKALMTSDMGFNPSNDGSAIIISLPQLTEERRNEVAKMVDKKMEETKIAIRKVREDFMQQMDDANESGDLSDDEFAKDKKELQKAIDAENAQIESLGAKKQEEIKQI